MGKGAELGARLDKAVAQTWGSAFLYHFAEGGSVEFDAPSAAETPEFSGFASGVPRRVEAFAIEVPKATLSGHKPRPGERVEELNEEGDVIGVYEVAGEPDSQPPDGRLWRIGLSKVSG